MAVSTDWSTTSAGSTDWSNGSINSTNWADQDDNGSLGDILLEDGSSSLLMETGDSLQLE